MIFALLIDGSIPVIKISTYRHWLNLTTKVRILSQIQNLVAFRHVSRYTSRHIWIHFAFSLVLKLVNEGRSITAKQTQKRHLHLEEKASSSDMDTTISNTTSNPADVGLPDGEVSNLKNEGPKSLFNGAGANVGFL